MIKNLWLLFALLLVFWAHSAYGETPVPKSIRVNNVGELSGDFIAIYVFEELPEYGHYQIWNTAIQYAQNDADTLTFDLVVPFVNIYIGNDDEMADPWTGEGDYYVALLTMDGIVYRPLIKDAYIYMDDNNTPVKVSLRDAVAVLDFKNFKQANKYYRMEIAGIYKDDLIYEYNSEASIEHQRYAVDLLIDVLYNGNVAALDEVIELNRLKYFNQAELRLLHNMIFIRYDYWFRLKNLRDYFSRFAWYKGTSIFMQGRMTPNDWRNIALIQNLERKRAFTHGKSSFGERLALGATIRRIEYPASERGGYIDLHWSRVRKLQVNGVLIAMIGRTEIEQVAVADSRFQIELGAVPDHLLTSWVEKSDIPPEFFSDAEIKTAHLNLGFKGTFIDAYGVEQSDTFAVQEQSRGMYDFYYYVYADRDAVVMGEREGDPGYTNGLFDKYPGTPVRQVFNVTLKKGWNKIYHHIFHNGKYIIQKTENSSEQGFFAIDVDWIE